jgi:glycosyltransferase involved in cell wall biosynthesis
MSRRPFTVAMVAGMPYPMAKASVIRVTNIVRALVNRYDEVRVKVFAYRGLGAPSPHPRIDLHLVGGFDASKSRYYSWSNKLAADCRLIAELLRHRHEFDLIHCHTIEGLGVAQAFRLLARSKVPVCIDVHGPIVAELVHYRLIPDWRPVVAVFTRLEQFMLSTVQQVFVSNEGLRQLLAGRVGAERVSVVYDYVDLDLFGVEHVDAASVALLRQQHKGKGERLLTYLGMFKDYQGVDYLLRAFARLVPAHPELRLALVGDGPCRAQYQDIIRATGIGERVIMPGLVPHGEVGNWLAVSDVVVSPRIDNHITRAGFVSQLPEYMAAGKLIVATWVSGCRHLLRDSAGIVVEANDVDALRSGIEQALTMTPAEQLSYITNARRNVAQFSWREGIADVYDSYRKLLGTKSG